ncbi:Mov34/MPN/PAD-1 family protein [Paraburkholderia azotifigens]|uniref:C40 family peptidase n=1 Tax=Paraburkholderia azotifigens TaxID=2057004 RepID=UPI003178EF2C
MIDHLTRQAIEAHALRCYPRECCGLVVDGRYIPCRNVATNPLCDFVIDAADYVVAEDLGIIEAVIHSHPDKSALPSIADLVACEADCAPRWIIVGISMGPCGPSVSGWHEFGRSEDGAPLIGCEFAHGSTDCYGLIRRYYKAALQIALPDFERRPKWWEDGQSNLYVDHYVEAGFRDTGVTGPIQPGDVLLMRIASAVPNHAAVYIGGDEILHHLWGQLSRREALPRYRNCVTHVLRHRNVSQ